MMEAIRPVLEQIVSVIIAPIVWLLFGVALVYFLYGAVKYLWGADSSEARDKGRMHMIYAVIGMAVMLSAFGIIQFIFNVVTDNGSALDATGKTIPQPSVIKKGSF